MLGPANLAATQLKVALKPTAGYEQQLWASTQPYTNPGNIQISGLNSGIYNANVADTTTLAANPQELVVALDSDINTVTPLVVTVTGLDQFGGPYTGTGTFSPPSYVQTQEIVFAKNFAVDLIPGTAGQKVKSITSVAVTCGADVAPLTLQIYGIPSFTTNPAQTGAFRLYSTKTKLDYAMGVPMPHAVQDGRNKSAFTKLGEIEEIAFQVTQKIQSYGDGLMRLNGLRFTGCVRELKETQVETMRSYLLGSICTSKPSTAQSVEDAEATGEGLAERMVTMIAH